MQLLILYLLELNFTNVQQTALNVNNSNGLDIRQNSTDRALVMYNFEEEFFQQCNISEEFTRITKSFNAILHENELLLNSFYKFSDFYPLKDCGSFKTEKWDADNFVSVTTTFKNKIRSCLRWSMLYFSKIHQATNLILNQYIQDPQFQSILQKDNRKKNLVKEELDYLYQISARIFTFFYPSLIFGLNLSISYIEELCCKIYEEKYELEFLPLHVELSLLRIDLQKEFESTTLKFDYIEKLFMARPLYLYFPLLKIQIEEISCSRILTKCELKYIRKNINECNKHFNQASKRCLSDAFFYEIGLSFFLKGEEYNLDFAAKDMQEIARNINKGLDKIDYEQEKFFHQVYCKMRKHFISETSFYSYHQSLLMSSCSQNIEICHISEPIDNNQPPFIIYDRSLFTMNSAGQIKATDFNFFPKTFGDYERFCFEEDSAISEKEQGKSIIDDLINQSQTLMFQTAICGHIFEKCDILVNFYKRKFFAWSRSFEIFKNLNKNCEKRSQFLFVEFQEKFVFFDIFINEFFTNCLEGIENFFDLLNQTERINDDDFYSSIFIVFVKPLEKKYGKQMIYTRLQQSFPICEITETLNRCLNFYLLNIYTHLIDTIIFFSKTSTVILRQNINSIYILIKRFTLIAAKIHLINEEFAEHLQKVNIETNFDNKLHLCLNEAYKTHISLCFSTNQLFKLKELEIEGINTGLNERTLILLVKKVNSFLSDLTNTFGKFLDKYNLPESLKVYKNLLIITLESLSYAFKQKFNVGDQIETNLLLLNYLRYLNPFIVDQSISTIQKQNEELRGIFFSTLIEYIYELAGRDLNHIIVIPDISIYEETDLKGFFDSLIEKNNNFFNILETLHNLSNDLDIRTKLRSCNLRLQKLLNVDFFEENVNGEFEINFDLPYKIFNMILDSIFQSDIFKKMLDFHRLDYMVETMNKYIGVYLDNMLKSSYFLFHEVKEATSHRLYIKFNECIIDLMLKEFRYFRLNTTNPNQMGNPMEKIEMVKLLTEKNLQYNQDISENIRKFTLITHIQQGDQQFISSIRFKRQYVKTKVKFVKFARYFCIRYINCVKILLKYITTMDIRICEDLLGKNLYSLINFTDPFIRSVLLNRGKLKSEIMATYFDRFAPMEVNVRQDHDFSAINLDNSIKFVLKKHHEALTEFSCLFDSFRNLFIQHCNEMKNIDIVLDEESQPKKLDIFLILNRIGIIEKQLKEKIKK